MRTIQGRPRCAALPLVALSVALAVPACSADQAPPTWDEWNDAEVHTLTVDKVVDAVPGGGIEVHGSVTGAGQLDAAITEVCGYETAADQPVRYSVSVGDAGRVVDGCGEPPEPTVGATFGALTSMDHVDEVSIIGRVVDVRAVGDAHLVDTARRVLAAVVAAGPPLLLVDGDRLHVRWTPDAEDVTEELDLLQRVFVAAGDRLEVAWLNDHRITATVRDDEEALRALRRQLDADPDDLRIAAPDDR